jgi:TonB family protein
MPQNLDILDERDPLTLPFIGSLILHGSVVALLFLYWYWSGLTTETFGDPNPSGGPAYAVSPTKSIPIPQKDAPPNPVAHDTESLVPMAPEEKKVEEKPPPMVPPKDAFEIPDKIKPKKEQPQPQQKYAVPAPPNQVYSHTPQAVSNPMYAAPAGAGQVGIGPNSVLGSRFGAYAQIIRERLAQNWMTNGLNARSQNAPAVVSFHIMRDGSVRDPRVVQSSGNYDIDNTALRAVYNSNPLPPLPPQVGENDILAEFTFNLR